MYGTFYLYVDIIKRGNWNWTWGKIKRNKQQQQQQQTTTSLKKKRAKKLKKYDNVSSLYIILSAFALKLMCCVHGIAQIQILNIWRMVGAHSVSKNIWIRNVDL